MNVYEEAHNLARAIKESEEYKQYNDLEAKVKENPELDNMLKDFQKKQFEFQTKQMLGEEIPNNMQEQIQNLYRIVAANPIAADYLQAEMRLGVMMNDVYKILGDIIGIGKE